MRDRGPTHVPPIQPCEPAPALPCCTCAARHSPPCAAPQCHPSVPQQDFLTCDFTWVEDVVDKKKVISPVKCPRGCAKQWGKVRRAVNRLLLQRVGAACASTSVLAHHGAGCGAEWLTSPRPTLRQSVLPPHRSPRAATRASAPTWSPTSALASWPTTSLTSAK